MSNQKEATAMIHDNQYHLLFPSENMRFRCYYERGMVWTKDYSDKLDFHSFYVYEGDLYGQSVNGPVYKFSKDVWDDAGASFPARIETKLFDFNEPYHRKKLKELQLIMESRNTRTAIRTEVYADTNKVVDTDTSYVSTDVDGNVTWVYENEPNLELKAGTKLGDWEMGSVWRG